jgi:hypothetical protein
MPQLLSTPHNVMPPHRLPAGATARSGVQRLLPASGGGFVAGTMADVGVALGVGEPPGFPLVTGGAFKMAGGRWAVAVAGGVLALDWGGGRKVPRGGSGLGLERGGALLFARGFEFTRMDGCGGGGAPLR